MNEFIVWDKRCKVFRKLLKIDFKLGLYFCIDTAVPFEKRDLVNDISLKDINGKSIYADSSIVKFDYLVDIENEIFQKRTGVFYFEKTFLAYHISFLTGRNRKGGNADKYNAFGMKNFEIIDTIQENKLGLIK